LNGTALASGLGQDIGAPHSAPRSVAGVVREPFLVRSQVGRLVELQVFDLGVPDDVAAFTEALMAMSSSLGGPAILLGDYRAAGPFPQEVGDAWSRAMRRFNASVERSAILLDAVNETFNLQIARVIRCAGSQRRRWFYDTFEARAWLADVVTPAEAARLDELLDG
jgi:hypothetical protein